MSIKQDLKDTIEETTELLTLNNLGQVDMTLMERVNREKALLLAYQEYTKLLELEAA